MKMDYSFKPDTFMGFFTFFYRLNIQLTDDQRFLEIEYKPDTSQPLYDICDINGRILKTGKLNGKMVRVPVNDLLSSAYVFLVMDGEQIRSKRFTIER